MAKPLEIKFEEGKTFISRLGEHISGPDIKQFIKSLEQYLNSKMTKRTVDDEIECGLDGDRRQEIMEFIITNTNIQQSQIVIKNTQIQQQQQVTHENETDNILNKINKKISLHFIKEGKASRTYLQNIEAFLDDNELDQVRKNLPKKLGTSSTPKEQDEFGLNGDYTKDTSKQIIIKKCIMQYAKNTNIPFAF